MRSKTPADIDLTNIRLPIKWWVALFGAPIALIFTLAMFYQQVKTHLSDNIAHAAPGQYETKKDAEQSYRQILGYIGKRLDSLDQRIDRVLERWPKK